MPIILTIDLTSRLFTIHDCINTGVMTHNAHKSLSINHTVTPSAVFKGKCLLSHYETVK